MERTSTTDHTSRSAERRYGRGTRTAGEGEGLGGMGGSRAGGGATANPGAYFNDRGSGFGGGGSKDPFSPQWWEADSERASRMRVQSHLQSLLAPHRRPNMSTLLHEARSLGVENTDAQWDYCRVMTDGVVPPLGSPFQDASVMHDRLRGQLRRLHRKDTSLLVDDMSTIVCVCRVVSRCVCVFMCVRIVVWCARVYRSVLVSTSTWVICRWRIQFIDGLKEHCT